MKKFFFAALAAAALLTVGCDSEETGGEAARLATPVLSSANVTEESFTVRWSAVEHAEAYSYSVNDAAAEETTSTSVTIPTTEGVTSYRVSVTALSADASQWLDSETATIAVSTTGGQPSGDLSDILFGDGTQLGNGDAEFEIRGEYTLPKGTYTLVGWVYICDGAKLTIEPGTVIRGDKESQATLIAERGGQLIAQGTPEEPIVFTSAQPAGQRRPGDWGGIILCGRARNNKSEMAIEGGPRSMHGGNDDSDSSGVLSYVRCEFAGYPFQTDEEINAITLGSVGSGTKIDHVQVSYSNDDSFEWFGGVADADHLVSYHSWDDDFDTDNGFSGHVQFALAVRDPRLADTSASNGFESDNNGDGTATEPFTSCVFSNVTFVGPIGQDPAFENTTSYINGGDYNPNNGSKLGQFQSAMQIRRNSHLSCFNSVAMGYPVGLIVENDKGSATQTAAAEGDLDLGNIFFAQMDVLGSDKNKSFVDAYTNDSDNMDPDTSRESFSAGFFKGIPSNRVFNTIADLMLDTDYCPLAGSPLLDAASFENARLSGFEQVSYVGAFAQGDDWLEGWTEFDPQNAQY